MNAEPPAWQLREMESFARLPGMSPDLIRYALTENLAAPSPSWRYVRAILKRLAASGGQIGTPPTRSRRAADPKHTYPQRTPEEGYSLPDWQLDLLAKEG